jgi:hypothetical protein
MKKIILLLVLFVRFQFFYGQTVSYEDFKSIIPYLQIEDWKMAFKESSRILSLAEKDTSEYKAIVLYMNIFSAAGMVSKEQMTFDELSKNIMKYQGQKIIMSGHQVTTEQGALKKLLFSVTDSTNEAFTSATNSKGTSIFCFEHFYLKDKVNTEDFKDAIVRCGGTLDKIEINPKKSLIWILRLTVKDAFARKTF